ncbi:Ras family protein [Pelomyxa schiedti]|nr:Ras family protein [Pelomyxa schiedti]
MLLQQGQNMASSLSSSALPIPSANDTASITGNNSGNSTSSFGSPPPPLPPAPTGFSYSSSLPSRPSFAAPRPPALSSPPSSRSPPPTAPAAPSPPLPAYSSSLPAHSGSRTPPLPATPPAATTGDGVRSGHAHGHGHGHSHSHSTSGAVHVPITALEGVGTGSTAAQTPTSIRGLSASVSVNVGGGGSGSGGVYNSKTPIMGGSVVIRVAYALAALRQRERAATSASGTEAVGYSNSGSALTKTYEVVQAVVCPTPSVTTVREVAGMVLRSAQAKHSQWTSYRPEDFELAPVDSPQMFLNPKMLVIDLPKKELIMTPTGHTIEDSTFDPKKYAASRPTKSSSSKKMKTIRSIFFEKDIKSGSSTAVNQQNLVFLVDIPRLFMYSMTSLIHWLNSADAPVTLASILIFNERYNREVTELREALEKQGSGSVTAFSDVKAVGSMLMWYLSTKMSCWISEKSWIELANLIQSDNLHLLADTLQRKLPLVERTHVKMVALLLNASLSKDPDSITIICEVFAPFIVQHISRDEFPLLGALLSNTLKCLMLPVKDPDHLLPNEQILLSVSNVICTNPAKEDEGRCCEAWCTNYRLCFKYLVDSMTYTTLEKQLEVSLSSIFNVAVSTAHTTGYFPEIKIICKDFRTIFVRFPQRFTEHSEYSHFLEIVNRGGQKVEPPVGSTREEQIEEGSSYVILKQLQSSGVTSWRLTQVNLRYTICSTYPSMLITPTVMTDEWIERNASRWLHSRFPVPVFFCAESKAFLLTSFSSSFSDAKESVTEFLQKAGISKVVFAKTGSHGNTQTEVDCSIQPCTGTLQSQNCCYLEAPTAAEVREGYLELRDLETDAIMYQKESIQMWVVQLKQLAKAVSTVTTMILGGSSVIIENSSPVSRHCDVDCCILSAVQVVLSSDFRTLSGFGQLIDRQWGSFGFPFSDSSLFMIFLQFIFLIWNIFQEYPQYFEFNEDFLLTVIDAFNSQRFGTFSHTNESELWRANRDKQSFWDYLLSLTNLEQYKNTLYMGETQDNILRITVSFSECSLWNFLLFRWNSAIQKEFVSSIRHIKRQIKQLDPPLSSFNCPSIELKNRNMFFLPNTVHGEFVFPLTENLNVLDLSGNNLNTFPLAILYLPNLRKLNLSSNNINHISDEVFRLMESHQKFLIDFSISSNPLVCLPSTLSLVELKILDVSVGKLASFPASLGNCRHLCRLNISRQHISGLSKTLPAFAPVIQDLNASSIGLAFYPSSWTDFAVLQSLNISLNFLDELPNDFTSLVYLKSLNISGNAFATFPNVILKMSTVMNLDISANDIQELPVGINCLCELRILRAHSNKISYVPASIGQLVNLKILELQDNLFEEIPPTIGYLSKLECLKLVGNGKSNLIWPPKDFAVMPVGPLLSFLHSNGSEKVNIIQKRVLVLGSSSVGKTAMLNCIRDKIALTHKQRKYALATYEEWRIPINFSERQENGHRHHSGILHVWEFSGSAGFYTSRPFLSNNVVVIFVCDISQPVNVSQVEEWLSLIYKHGPIVPILFVATHREKLSPSELASLKGNLFLRLQQQFPNICGSVAISPPTMKGFSKYNSQSVPPPIQTQVTCLYSTPDYQAS